MLRRLGGWSCAHRRLVAGAWIVVVVAVGVLAGALSKPTNDAFNVPGTEAQRALDLLDEHFPGAGGATARLVFADLHFLVPVADLKDSTKDALRKVGEPARKVLVRMTLVPAVLALLGARAWWLPGWLDRHLPHVDIEGDDEPRPAATPSPV